jgi:hypothetical protein
MPIREYALSSSRLVSLLFAYEIYIEIKKKDKDFP